jgi:hypothetical protein
VSYLQVDKNTFYISNTSLHSGHCSRQFLGFSLIWLPSGSDSLPLSVECNGTLSIKVCCSPHGRFVTSETEHWKWNWDWKIDTNLSSFDLMLELSCITTRLSEDSNTITLWVIVG